MANEKPRELSPAEKIRAENFEKTRQSLIESGYSIKDLTMSVSYANKMTLVLTLPIVLCLLLVFWLRNGINPEWLDVSVIEVILFFAVFYVLAAVHEVIHGITWSIFASKGWKAVSFGFILKQGMAYCSCDEALKKGEYITGTLMPTIILGIIPSVISVFTGSVFLLLIGICMIMAGGGDMAIIHGLIRFNPQHEDVLYIDHPYEIGLAAFVR